MLIFKKENKMNNIETKLSHLQANLYQDIQNDQLPNLDEKEKEAKQPAKIKKYELLKTDTKVWGGKTFFRIRALISFDIVKIGDLGGYVSDETCLINEFDNSSSVDNSWVDNTSVDNTSGVYNSVDNSRVDSGWVYNSVDNSRVDK